MIKDRKKTLSIKFRNAGSSGRKLHVMSRNGFWVVFREGSEKIISEFDTKRNAILNGKKLLSSEEANVLVVHRTDGSVEKIQTSN
ncbi:DUF2188 domain-containing protein [Brumimicrobium glaciale]|uniref:DUF2188 domain-containing protein n=1 Tax=Brumimicrobium glaciale TaxID=200475 RepID=A0A4Q4KI45_9FLAO|nr:DUF2188 domain-containing protein [Brumimicrobium glaciale]RYM32825.1 DUF2188 domain-containing protein [Brumimicrobium glaciale]